MAKTRKKQLEEFEGGEQEQEWMDAWKRRLEERNAAKSRAREGGVERASEPIEPQRQLAAGELDLTHLEKLF